VTVDFHAARAAAAAAGLDSTTVTVAAADDAVDRAARHAGFHCTRELLQLRRPLPITDTTEVPVRTYRPADAGAWLDVNNRAFAWHPEQGGWTLAQLHATQAEPWYDPAGFLVHEAPDGRLDAFCWTKVHGDVDPPVGEIFVIAVDPAAHGAGLGRALVVAGLTHLQQHGLHHAMLYVEADNAPALQLYDALGFTVHERTRWYTWTADGAPST